MPANSHVVALMKDGERFVFLFDASSISQLLQTFGRYAADPELNFSWYDAAVMSQRVRKIQAESEVVPSATRRTA